MFSFVIASSVMTKQSLESPSIYKQPMNKLIFDFLLSLAPGSVAYRLLQLPPEISFLAPDTLINQEEYGGLLN